MTWWFLIPIVAILVGGFTEWLKFKEKQLKLGDTTSTLSGNLDHIESQLDATIKNNERLQERVKNLEAIVTTQMWDQVVDGGSQSPANRPELLEIPEEESSDEEKARKLARRMRH
ncbi:MAG: hypothetical protein HKN43_10865 [Rhodothermales bacterium]|nr:hypothetical protein [Rhodothermales bacterium]